MKYLVIAMLVAPSLSLANDIYHQGYIRADGTYVAPHYQTAPDNNRHNNYSTQGNINPYNGQRGTVNPYQQQQIQQPYSNQNNSYWQNRQRRSY